MTVSLLKVNWRVCSVTFDPCVHITHRIRRFYHRISAAPPHIINQQTRVITAQEKQMIRRTGEKKVSLCREENYGHTCYRFGAS